MTTSPQEKIAIFRDRFGVRYCPKALRWKHVGNNREVMRDRMVAHIVEAFPTEPPMVVMQDVQDFVNAAHEESTKKAVEGIPERLDEFQLVAEWMDENAIVVQENGTFEGGDLATLPIAVHRYNRLICQVPQDLRKEHGLVRLSVSVTQEVFEGIVSEMHHEKMQAMREKVAFDRRYRKLANEAYDTLCDILVEPGDPRRDLHRWVLVHMIWQIKRKLFGLPVKDHLLLFLYGRQGGGKTTLIRKIGAVLGSLYVEPSVDELYAKFGSSFTADHFMGNLEEFTWSAGSETQAMKKFVTQDVRSERRMHSMGTQRKPQNLTLFASSNRKLRRVFTDYSGMRRFWEIDCDWARPTLNHDLVNGIDYLALFKGVDESLDEAPIRRIPDVFERISLIQDKWRKQSVVEQWLRGQDMYPVIAGDPTIEMEIEALFREFNDWSEEHDRKSMGSLDKFKGFLEDLRDIDGDFESPKGTVIVKRPGGRSSPRSHDDSGLGATPVAAATEAETGWEDFE